MSNDVLSEFWTDPGDMREERRAGSVHIHAHPVDNAFHHTVEGVSQSSLIYIMLIQTHTDRLGVDFYQFSQRVLCTACNGHCPTNSNVQLGEFLACQSRGGIDRGAGFIDDQILGLRRIPDK